MPRIEKHAAGTFCWIELATTNQDSAKHFYSSIFGWVPADFPMGPNEFYTMFNLSGGEAAAAYTMREAERSMSPPHWNLYVAVDSADSTAKLAAELGGKILAGPFDVMTFGRMAVIQDPTGVVFCIWEPKDHIGTTVSGEHGTACWADLNSPDADRARTFYEGLFGWKIAAAPNFPADYPVIQNEGQMIGGIAPAAFRNPHTPPHWMIFFLADDIDGVAAKTKDLGGAMYMPPGNMGGARLAVLADPQGATFSVIRPPAQG